MMRVLVLVLVVALHSVCAQTFSLVQYTGSAGLIDTTCNTSTATSLRYISNAVSNKCYALGSSTSIQIIEAAASPQTTTTTTALTYTQTCTKTYENTYTAKVYSDNNCQTTPQTFTAVGLASSGRCASETGVISPTDSIYMSRDSTLSLWSNGFSQAYSCGDSTCTAATTSTSAGFNWYSGTGCNKANGNFYQNIAVGTCNKVGTDKYVKITSGTGKSAFFGLNQGFAAELYSNSGCTASVSSFNSNFDSCSSSGSYSILFNPTSSGHAGNIYTCTGGVCSDSGSSSSGLDVGTSSSSSTSGISLGVLIAIIAGAVVVTALLCFLFFFCFLCGGNCGDCRVGFEECCGGSCAGALCCCCPNPASLGVKGGGAEGSGGCCKGGGGGGLACCAAGGACACFASCFGCCIGGKTVQVAICPNCGAENHLDEKARSSKHVHCSNCNHEFKLKSDQGGGLVKLEAAGGTSAVVGGTGAAGSTPGIVGSTAAGGSAAAGGSESKGGEVSVGIDVAGDVSAVGGGVPQMGGEASVDVSMDVHVDVS